MKNTRKAADIAADAARTALHLLNGNVSFGGAPFPITDAVQQRMTEDVYGTGNICGCAEAFAAAGTLAQRAASPLPAERIHARLEDPLAARRFSFACAPCDPLYAAMQVLFTLILQRNVKKYLLAFPSSADREGMSEAVEAYAERFVDFYACAAPRILLYNSRDMRPFMEFLCTAQPALLLLHRDAFCRTTNLLRRSSPALAGRTPLSLLAAAHPVLAVPTRRARDAAAVLRRGALFEPLCTLVFTEAPDRTGLTLPVFPGKLPVESAAAPEEGEQLCL